MFVEFVGSTRAGESFSLGVVVVVIVASGIKLVAGVSPFSRRSRDPSPSFPAICSRGQPWALRVRVLDVDVFTV